MGNAARTVTLNVVAEDRASKTLDTVAGKAETSSGRFGRAFSGMGGLLNQVSGGALGPLVEHLEAARSSMEHMGESGGKLAGNAMKWGAGIAAFGAGLTMLGDKDKAAQQQLKVAIDNTGQSFADYKDEIEKAIKGQEKFGHSASETQNALQNLTQSTNDPKKALEYLGVASDLAAAKHISLVDASTKLSTVLSGKGARVLAQFGIAATGSAVSMKTVESATKSATAADDGLAKSKQNLSDLLDKQHAKTKLTEADHVALRKAEEAVTVADGKASAAHKTLAADQAKLADTGLQGAAAVDALSRKLHGQADAAANTFTGRMKALKTEIEDGAAKLGQKYGPALTALGTTMAGLGGVAKMFSGGMKTAQTATEGLTAGTEALTVAEDAEVVSEGLALGPILLIIAAIAILAVGIYLLVTHWKQVWSWIKQAVSDAWEFISGIITGAVDWIKGHWQLLVAILTGPFGLLVLFVKDHFNQIMQFIGGIPSAIGRIATSIGKALANGWIWGINAVISAWDWMMGFLKIPGFSIGPLSFSGIDLGSGLKIGHIPYLAEGGIVTHQTLAMLGEGGKKEAVVPLDRAHEFGFGGQGGQGGGQVACVYLDGREVGKILLPHLRTQVGGGTRRNAVVTGF